VPIVVIIMGASSSSCCGAQEAPETEIDLSPSIPRLPKQNNAKTCTKDRGPPSSDGETGQRSNKAMADEPTHVDEAKHAEDAMMEEFKKRIEEGIDVNIILQDKSRLKCKVKLDRAAKGLVLTCGAKVRTIILSEIRSILHTAEQLSRVENSAGIGVSEPCAAIHLSTGNCIPLFFVSEDSKKCFVEVVRTACQE